MSVCEYVCVFAYVCACACVHACACACVRERVANTGDSISMRSGFKNKNVLIYGIIRVQQLTLIGQQDQHYQHNHMPQGD